MEEASTVRSRGLSGNVLKIIAIVTMLIDHIGAVIIEPGIFHAPDQAAIQAVLATDAGLKWFAADQVLRTVGRIAFPIFCFLLVEGFLHTKDWKKYAARLLAFALISEIPFDMAVFGSWFNPEYQNVFFTLFVGLLVLEGYRRFESSQIKQILVMLAGCVAAFLLRCDYNVFGIVLIVILYLFRNNRKYRTLAGGLMAALESSSFFCAAALAFIPIHLYNGTRGKLRLKYLFYWFYPVHLLILYAIRIVVF